jgi:hypothetical protein
MNVSARSKSPLTIRFWTTARNKSTNTPSRTQHRKGRRQVWYGGNFVGISDHCAPVRRIHSTSSRTGRVSFQRRPRRCGDVLGSTSDLSNSTAAAVSSIANHAPVNSTRTTT